MKGKSNLLKKMMAMLLTAALIIGMVVGVVPEEVHAETTTDGYEYTDNGDNTVAITGYHGSDTTLVIPNEIDGKTVTAIESPGIEVSGFPSYITKVIIPGSVTSIGDYAFYSCSGLATVTIPEGVKSIGVYAFYECKGLTEVTIPSSVTSIGNGAFCCCEKLTTITIPSSVTSIGWSAFAYCRNLTTVTIPSSVTSIGDGAFAFCDSLTEVTIPRSVTSIGGATFWDCKKLTTVTIPSSVTRIGEDAFYGCSSLESVKYGCCKTNWGGISMSDSGLDTNQITVEYNVTAHKAKAATCTENGNKEYYECSGCHGAYSDPNGENSITKPIIPAKGHTPADAVEENRVDSTCAKEGSYDMVVRCSVCGAEISRTTKTIEKKAHSYGGWTVTKQPTESEEGSKERSCSVCGYKQTEVIPKTGNTGKIETDIEQEKNALDADFKMSKDDLISAVLTPEEQSLVAAGTDVKIILDIDNIDASVDEADKQAVTDKADGYNVGQYLDINLYKIIGEDKTKISQTNGKIKIAIDVPDSLKNTDSVKTRSFAVVRVHDGVAEMLTDLDNDGATITFETDLFSTYAIVYKDTVDTNKKDDEPKTGDITPIEIYATLAMIAGLSYLVLLFGNRKRGMTEQEKKEWTAVLVAWGRKGGALRKVAALVAIFLLLAYYHSIGKKIKNGSLLSIERKCIAIVRTD